MLNKLSELWTDIKAWFKNSETIFWSRLQVFVGFVVASLAAIDWTQLATFSLGDTMSVKQMAVLGGGLILNGLWQEYLRRRNANL